MTFLSMLLLFALQGEVRDAGKHPLASVTVSLQRNGESTRRSIQTDKDGKYYFAGMAAGKYELKAELAGYTSVTMDIEATSEKTLDLTLQQAFFDEPQYTVAGVTDNTYRGGHGADTVLRSAEKMTQETSSLGKTNDSASNFKDALPAAERASVLNQNDPEVWRRLGDIYEGLGRSLDAVHAYQKAADISPTEINLFDLGTEFLSHLAPEAAAETFTKGNRLFPVSSRMVLGLAVALYSRGLYEDAAQRFFQACDLNPNDPAPYMLLGKVERFEITRSDAFIEHMKRFAEQQPTNPWANYYYAITLWKQSSSANDVKVRSLLEEAIKLAPALAPAHLQLGIIESDERNMDLALIEFQKSAELDPTMEEPHYRLAQIYKLKGESELAQRELRLYTDLSKRSSSERERQRNQVQKFVLALRNPSQ